MDDLRPALLEQTHFDAIVLGTGLCESIVAAELARDGKSVLHLDVNDYYGGTMATFNLQALADWAKAMSDPTTAVVPGCLDTTEFAAQEGLAFSPIRRSAALAKPAFRDFDLFDRHSDERPSPLYRSSIARRFNIDLSPRMVACQGDLVSTIVRSTVGRYLEFKSLESLYVYESGGEATRTTSPLRRVPSTRDDIFADDSIGRVEKRYLMKFIEYCSSFSREAVLADPSQGEPFLSQSLTKLLESRNISSESLQKFIKYAIALLPNDPDGTTVHPHDLADSTVASAVPKVQAFIRALGHYGTSNFLYPMYGISELSQGFCRIIAVHNGIHILRRGVSAIVTDAATGEYRGIVCSAGQTLTSTQLITSMDYVPFLVENARPSETYSIAESGIARAIIVTNVSLVAGKDIVSIIIPPYTIGNAFVIHVTQTSSSNESAPDGLYVVHFSTVEVLGVRAVDQLRAAVDLFFAEQAFESDFGSLVPPAPGPAPAPAPAPGPGPAPGPDSTLATTTPTSNSVGSADGGGGGGGGREGESEEEGGLQGGEPSTTPAQPPSEVTHSQPQREPDGGPSSSSSSSGGGDQPSEPATGSTVAPEGETEGGGGGGVRLPPRLWSLYFTQTNRRLTAPGPRHLHVVHDTGYSFSLEEVMKGALALHEVVLPGSPFMPVVPGPDDYAYVDDDNDPAATAAAATAPPGDDGAGAGAEGEEVPAGGEAVGGGGGGGGGVGQEEATQGRSHGGESSSVTPKEGS